MHVRGVAGEEHAPIAVGRRLTGHVGEAGEPRRVANTEVRPVDRDERRRGARPASARRLGATCGSTSTTPTRLPSSSLPSALTPFASRRMPRRRLFGHLDLGDQEARPTRPIQGTRCRPVLRTRLRPPSQPTRYSARSDRAVRQLDVDAGVVLREPCHLAPAIERHRQLGDPVGEDALDVILQEREPVVVARREVADVERDEREACDLHRLALARGSARRCPADRTPRSCARAGRPRASRELLAPAPLDDGDVDLRQRELGCQHQAGRSSTGDHHRMLFVATLRPDSLCMCPPRPLFFACGRRLCLTEGGWWQYPGLCHTAGSTRGRCRVQCASPKRNAPSQTQCSRGAPRLLLSATWMGFEEALHIGCALLGTTRIDGGP